ncbi:T9SS type A sorting domain-containing protein [candidate division GN15 bacterium]|nr:T9SS type A sorting domain-containing protein [candidate division GN15 bacterium]
MSSSLRSTLALAVVLTLIAPAVSAQAPINLDSLVNYPLEIHGYFWTTDWQIASRSSSTTDLQGRVTEILFENYNVDSARWEPDRRFNLAWTTNPGPDTVTEWSADSDFDFWFEETRWIFSYDAQGRIEVKLEQGRPFAFWDDDYRTTYTYVGDDLITETIEMNVQGTWENYHKFEYSHQTSSTALQQSVLTESIKYFWHLGSWRLWIRTSYTYSGGLEAEKLVENRNGGVWEPDDRFLSTYAGQQLDTYTGQTWNGSTWDDIMRTQYQDYDQQGRALTVISGFYFGGSWEPTSKQEYVYDVSTAVDDPAVSQLPDGFALSQNYPNPFNPTTTIEFTLPVRAQISIEVIDILGRQVTELLAGEVPAGTHSVGWDGRDRDGDRVASGLYFYRLQTESGSLSRKMLLLK